ncbi:DUF2254 domain-containing protein [Mycobacterium sp. ELW1]|nr:DUF2254 domain-containing protein [Mycobacterium sp. ELW1]
MLRDVHQDASATVRIVTSQREETHLRPAIPTPPHGAVALTAPSSGFLASIDESELFSAATRAEACLVIDSHRAAPS